LKSQINIEQTEWQQIKYRPNNITFSYRRDFTITKSNVSITTLESRNKYEIICYPYTDQFFDGTWTFCASKLVKHKDGDYYFHLSCEKEIIPQEISATTDIIGVDVGINYLAVATTTDKNNKFFYGGEIKNIRNIFSRQRKRLQLKGTRSAKRVLRHQKERETRLMNDVNHKVSKKIIEFASQHKIPMIGLEDLTGIRDTTKVRKKQRYQHSSWAFRQLQTFIEYKATEKGIRILYIDPKYTSQTCSRCGHIEKNNRNGMVFLCKSCGFEMNADLNASRNIEHKTRDFRHDLEFQGCNVSHPDGTNRTTDDSFSSKPRPQIATAI